MDDSEERWLPIPGYLGYDVSDQGRVRSWRKIGRPFPAYRLTDAPRMLHPRPSKRGYLVVSGGRGTVVVHKLVMLAFVGPRPDGMETRHLNGDRLDNRLSNLAYGTSSENTQDTLRHGRHYAGRRTHKVRHKVRTACFRGHPYTEANTLYPPSGGRQCRTCNRERARRNRQRVRHDDTRDSVSCL